MSISVSRAGSTKGIVSNLSRLVSVEDGCRKPAVRMRNEALCAPAPCAKRASLESRGSSLARTEAVRTSLSEGVLLHQMEAYLDWLVAVGVGPGMEKQNPNHLEVILWHAHEIYSPFHPSDVATRMALIDTKGCKPLGYDGVALGDVT